MKKGSFAAHPVFGAFVGVTFALCFFSIEHVIKPIGRAHLGASWSLFTGVIYFFLIGVLTKTLMLSLMSREMDIVPQTPVEFAGVGDENSFRKPSSLPLPEIPAEGAASATRQPDCPLDFYGLETVTGELQNLGFVLTKAGALKTDKKITPAYVRMLEHENGAIAEIYQMFPRGRKASPLNTSFFTYYPDEWSITDSNQATTWLTWMCRRPRSLSKSHVRGVSTRDMWRSHLERRIRVEDGLSLKPVPHDVPAHLDRASHTLRWMRRAVIFRSLFIAQIQNLFFRPKNREWWGEFHKFAKS